MHNSSHHGGLRRRAEAPDWLLGKRIGDQQQLVSGQLTPPTTVATVVPNDVDRTFPDGAPAGVSDLSLFRVNLNQRARGNDVSQAIILEPDQGIKKTLRLQAAHEFARKRPPIIQLSREKTRLHRRHPEIKIHREAEIGPGKNRSIRTGRNRRGGGRRDLGLLGFDSEHSEQLVIRYVATAGQTENLVGTGNGPGFNRRKRGMRNVEPGISSLLCNQPALSLDITRLEPPSNQQLFDQPTGLFHHNPQWLGDCTAWPPGVVY